MRHLADRNISHQSTTVPFLRNRKSKRSDVSTLQEDHAYTSDFTRPRWIDTCPDENPFSVLAKLPTDDNSPIESVELTSFGGPPVTPIEPHNRVSDRGSVQKPSACRRRRPRRRKQKNTQSRQSSDIHSASSPYYKIMEDFFSSLPPALPFEHRPPADPPRTTAGDGSSQKPKERLSLHNEKRDSPSGWNAAALPVPIVPKTPHASTGLSTSRQQSLLDEPIVETPQRTYQPDPKTPRLTEPDDEDDGGVVLPFPMDSLTEAKVSRQEPANPSKCQIPSRKPRSSHPWNVRSARKITYRADSRSTSGRPWKVTPKPQPPIETKGSTVPKKRDLPTTKSPPIPTRSPARTCLYGSSSQPRQLKSNQGITGITEKPSGFQPSWNPCFHIPSPRSSLQPSYPFPIVTRSQPKPIYRPMSARNVEFPKSPPVLSFSSATLEAIKSAQTFPDPKSPNAYKAVTLSSNPKFQLPIVFGTSMPQLEQEVKSLQRKLDTSNLLLKARDCNIQLMRVELVKAWERIDELENEKRETFAMEELVGWLHEWEGLGCVSDLLSAKLGTSLTPNSCCEFVGQDSGLGLGDMEEGNARDLWAQSRSHYDAFEQGHDEGAGGGDTEEGNAYDLWAHQDKMKKEREEENEVIIDDEEEEEEEEEELNDWETAWNEEESEMSWEKNEVTDDDEWCGFSDGDGIDDDDDEWDEWD